MEHFWTPPPNKKMDPTNCIGPTIASYYPRLSVSRMRDFFFLLPENHFFHFLFKECTEEPLLLEVSIPLRLRVMGGGQNDTPVTDRCLGFEFFIRFFKFLFTHRQRGRQQDKDHQEDNTQHINIYIFYISASIHKQKRLDVLPYSGFLTEITFFSNLHKNINKSIV